jgi:hypothetical protein
VGGGVGRRPGTDCRKQRPVDGLASNFRLSHIALFSVRYRYLFDYLARVPIPGQVPGGWGAQISRQTEYEGGKVSPAHRPPLPPQEIFMVLISPRGWVISTAVVRLEGLYQWKLPVTLKGIQLATFQRVAQCLSELHHRGLARMRAMLSFVLFFMTVCAQEKLRALQVSLF